MMIPIAGRAAATHRQVECRAASEIGEAAFGVEDPRECSPPPFRDLDHLLPRSVGKWAPEEAARTALA